MSEIDKFPLSSEWRDTPVPPVLWHYTSLSGFMGIVNSRTIYATDLRYLNDKEELLHARTLMKEIWKELTQGTKDVPFRGLLDTLLEVLFGGDGTSSSLHVFVASFSTARDQLSQWRAYSGQASGVCLGLDLNHIRSERCRFNLDSFAPCIYENELKREMLKSGLTALLKQAEAASARVWPEFETEFKKVLASKPSIEGKEVAKSLVASHFGKRFIEVVLDEAMGTAYELLRVAALMKHPSFYEEQEWRFVFPASKDADHNHDSRKYRRGETTLIPYIDLPLCPNGGDALPLLEVLLGPESEPLIAQEAAELFLKDAGVKAIVSGSGVPYRKW